MSLHNQTQKEKKLLECFLTRNSKLYLGKVYTEKQLKKLDAQEVEKLFNNYEAKLSGQIVKSLGCSIIHIYSMGACAALGITNHDALSEHLENDPFLNSALQRFICELYYRFGSFLAPLSVRLIMSRHYLSEHNNNGGTSGTSEGNKDEGPSGRSQRSYWIFYGYGYGGFCFVIGLNLTVTAVNNLEELISKK